MPCGDKKGNDVYCEFSPEGPAIINSMPRVEPQIFPYSTSAISAAFIRACRFLEIKDLRFHIPPHEEISRLFELGGTIPQAAAVSGHRSWTSLKRYTHIRQSSDKYESWTWLRLVTEAGVIATVGCELLGCSRSTGLTSSCRIYCGRSRDARSGAA